MTTKRRLATHLTAIFFALLALFLFDLGMLKAIAREEARIDRVEALQAGQRNEIAALNVGPEWCHAAVNEMHDQVDELAAEFHGKHLYWKSCGDYDIAGPSVPLSCSITTKKKAKE